MQTIKRDIYVTKNVLQAPIEVTEGTNSIAIEFDVRDYDIPASAAAVVYSMCTSTMAEPNKALAEVDGNTITIIPSESFFHAGQNVMQIRVIDGDSKLISFNIIVKCTGKMRFGDEEEEKQTTLIEQILVKLGGYIEKLRNVRAVFFGDSTTWGESGETDGVQVSKPYPTVFGEITGATIVNCAVRGACGSSAKTNNFAEQIAANSASIKAAKKIFVNFGINDFSQNINVGNASMTDSFYYGIYNGIATIQKSNPKADIIIILPTVGKGYLTNAAWRNSNGIGFDDYINALIDIGTKLHLKIVDFRNIGITKNNAATYYPTGYNHLTQDGYTLLGEHLARCYESNIYYGDVEEKSVAMNVLPHLLFASPIEASSLNSFYNGIYWKLSGTDDKGLTSYKQFDIQTGQNYHFEFMAYHRNVANARKIDYTIIFKNTSTSKTYTFKRSVTGSYNKVAIDFYSNLTGGNYTLQLIASGDDAYVSAFILSFNGVAPARKMRTGIVEITSTNTLSVLRNKFINGFLIFNLVITAKESVVNLARINLNPADDNYHAYIPTGSLYFWGIDWTTKEPALMQLIYDSEKPGTYLLKLATGNAVSGHKYVAKDIIYMGRNDAPMEIITQEW
nr:MAG TPA: Baseplate component [Caudoviricetes sp.]